MGILYRTRDPKLSVLTPTAKAMIRANEKQSRKCGSTKAFLRLTHLIPRVPIVITNKNKASTAAININGLLASHKYGRNSDTLIAAGAIAIMLLNDPSKLPRV